nr:DUF4124 domain-containing protein [Accumulibacter sp.]
MIRGGRSTVRSCLGLALVLALLGSVHAQSVYRWTDQQGRVHYSDAPSDTVNATVIECPPPPTPQQLEDAQQRIRREQQALTEMQARRSAADRQEGVIPPRALGPLPANETSGYMRTRGTGVSCEWRPERSPAYAYRFSLALQVHDDVPVGAFIEAEFENPPDEAHPLLATAVIDVSGPGQVKVVDVFLLTPLVDTIRCGNHRVTVRLYRSRQSRELLGTHQQLIQSRFDSALWTALGKNAFDYLQRNGHVCPYP